MQLNQSRNNLYVISAANEGRGEQENDERYDDLKTHMQAQGVAYTEAEGRYQGVKEKSLILIGTHKLVAHHYASIYGQECFLRLEPHRDNMYKAYVVDVVTGDEEMVGYFRSFSEGVILQLDLDYTKDSNGTFFSIWPSDETDIAEHFHKIGERLVRTMETGGKQ